VCISLDDPINRDRYPEGTRRLPQEPLGFRNASEYRARLFEDISFRVNLEEVVRLLSAVLQDDDSDRASAKARLMYQGEWHKKKGLESRQEVQAGACHLCTV